MKSIATVVLVVTLLSLVVGQSSIYDQYYQEALKIAQSMTIDQKIGQTLIVDLQGISNREKQTTDPQQAVTFGLGSVFIGGNAAPTTDGNLAKIPSNIQVDKVRDAFMKQTTQNWKKLIDRFKDLGVSVTTKDGTKYKVKFLFGTDAVHGDQHVLGNILWPHNIGLSCSHNEKHFQNMGFWTKTSMKKTGFNFAFGPTVAVSHNPQWGRFYQSLGQEDPYIYKYGQSFVKGLQDVQNGKINGVLASAKHFFGDGSTIYGTNIASAQVISFKNYISHNIQGYYGAVKQNVGSVMISYNSVNYVSNSFNSLFLSGLLREDIGFKGFTLSDYNDVISSASLFMPRTYFNMTQQQGWATMLNGGTDMFMISGQHSILDSQIQRIIKQAKKAVTKQMVFEQRLDEAVARILTVKMAMGLIQKGSKQQQKQNVQQKTQDQLQVNTPQTSSGNEYQDSLDAVHESLVLLKNSNVLPLKSLKSTIKYVVLVGQKIHNLNGLTKIQLFKNFDNIGMQSGGWSVRWQGYQGNDFWTGANKQSSNASSLLDSLKQLQKINNFQLVYPQYSSQTNQITIDTQRRKFEDDLKTKRKNMTSRNTIIIGVFGQFPYAQTIGDINSPYCSLPDNTACLYDPSINPYAPGYQSKTLKIQFSNFEANVIDIIKGADKTIPLISVLISGRPMLIDDIMQPSSAFIAAWLPGTSGGQGILDAITGDYLIRPNGTSSRVNTLSVDWPRDMDSLSRFPIYDVDGQIPKIKDPQFLVGYGLSTSNPTSKLIQSQ